MGFRRHKQLIKHDPASGKFGDCFRTAIASALCLEPEEVPHFAERGADWGVDRDRTRIQKWFRERNMELGRLTIDFDKSEEDDLWRVLNWWYQCNRQSLVLVTVGSTGCNHVIVCKNREVVCDPATGERALTSDFGPAREEDHLYWELFFFMPYHPDRLARPERDQ